MTNNWTYALNEIEKLRKSQGIILFDISLMNWNPPLNLLDRFTKIIYENLVSKHKELEVTREYFMTASVLIATGVNSRKNLAFTSGAGPTGCEEAETHGRGWALKGLVDKIRDYREPINFKFFEIGYISRHDG